MSAILLLFALDAAPAASTAKPPPKRDDQETVRTEREVEIIGLRTNHGRAWDFGAAYLHGHQSSAYRGGLGAMTFFQYGVDVRAVRHEGEFRSMLAFATGRISLLGDAGGFGIEGNLGTNFGHDAPVVGEVGAFFGAFFVELGYAYRFPIGHERPDWMSSHQFAFRIQIPFYFHEGRTWKEK